MKAERTIYSSLGNVTAKGRRDNKMLKQETRDTNEEEKT